MHLLGNPDQQEPRVNNVNATGAAVPPQGAAGMQPLEELNLYLRRMAIGGSQAMSSIDYYSGGTDFDMFVDAVKDVADMNGWDDAQAMRALVTKLKDQAREYYGALMPSERPRTLEHMREWLRRIFGRKLSLEAGKRELDRCIRNPDEPLGAFVQRLKILARRMFPEDKLPTHRQCLRDALLVEHFLQGLDGRLANEIVRQGEFLTIDEALEAAVASEQVVSRMITETKYDVSRASIRRVEECAQQQMAPANPPPQFQPRQMPPQRRPYQHRSRVPGPNRFEAVFPYMLDRCMNCGEHGHRQWMCQNNTVRFCFACGKKGRTWEQCHLNWQAASGNVNR